MMKRLLLLLPLLLTACGEAVADFTTDDPFQVTCTYKVDGKIGNETYFIDPKLDIVEMKGLDGEDGSPYNIEYIVTKVAPLKIVFGSEWMTPTDKNEDHFREESVFDRRSGKLTPVQYELARSVTFSPLLAQTEQAKKVELDYEYECQKPTRD